MPLPSHLREMHDTDTARNWLYEDTTKALQTRFPIEDDQVKFELTDVAVEPRRYNMTQQKAALLNGRQLRVPVKATMRLTDKASGVVLDERRDTVMQLPYLTERGTVVYNGNEYSSISQSRLKPGAYTRVRRSGQPETFFNVRPRTGKSFRMWMQPETGVFKVHVGQANIPAYSLLKSMGMDDKDMMKTWGPEITEANIRATGPNDTDKLYSRFAGAKADQTLDPVSRRAALLELLGKSEIDPDVVATTLGIQNAKGLTPQMLLRATEKMLNVSRQSEQPDDRDAPMFSNVLSIEDLIPERVTNDAGQLARSLLWKAKRDKSLKRIPAGALNPYVDNYMFGSRLTLPLEETNPLAILEQMQRVTKLGEGGISSAESVTDEARNVNPGQLGFIDPVMGPEGCWPPDAEVMTRTGWVRWDSVTKDTEFGCLLENKLQFHRAEALLVYNWDGPLYGARSKFVSYLVTSKHRLWTRPYDDSPLPYRFEPADYTHNRARMLKVGGHTPYTGADLGSFALPDVQGGNATRHTLEPIPMHDWAAFMGWYLSEGHTHIVPDKRYEIVVSQHQHENTAELKRVLNTLPLPFAPKKDGQGVLHGYGCNRKQLAEYLVQFGGSHDKFIPEYLFDAPETARRALLQSLCLGDGRAKKETYTYCTSSRQLALDVERLAFGLGYSTRVRFEADSRPQSRTGGMWCVHLHTRTERVIHGDKATANGHYYTQHYTGKVYCATVPGGLMYCRYGEYGGHWSGNTNIGIDVRTSFRTYKGRDKQLYAQFTNARTGETEYVKPEQLHKRVIAFPGEMNRDVAEVDAIVDGVMKKVPKKEVDYAVPSFSHLVSSHAQLNPLPTSYQSARAFYGSKFWSQYMPQVKGEIPLVDTVLPDEDTTFSEYYGRLIGSMKAEAGGKVVDVTDDQVTIQDKNGKKHTTDLVKYFPFNRLTGISYFPTVAVGDEVAEGQTIGHSNFTDKKTGSLTMGQNLRTAVIPYKGRSYEDAYVISQAAANKLATERLYGFDQEAKHGVELDKNKYVALFSDKFKKDQLAKLDSKGVVQVGQTLEYGDPIVLAVGPKLLGAEDLQLGKLHKALRNAHTDKALVWEHDYPGLVVDAVHTRSGAAVNVAAKVPVKVGDKLSTRYGLKGVVGTIVDDDQMPRDAADNTPYDLLLNPMGILSRVAPAQLAEMQLTKIAKMTGKQFRLPAEAPEEGWEHWTLNKLKEAGIPEDGVLFDPERGRNLPAVANGYTYTMAFHHLGEKKLSERGSSGVSYTADEQPARGGSETAQAKKMSSMDMYALLAHGATEVVKDAQTIRGAKNEDYWKKLKMGLPLPKPQVPFVYRKFLDTLKAGGINIREQGNSMTLLPMTDDDVLKMSKGEISNSGIVDDDMQPVKGGLFDVGRTGGLPGRSWSHVSLHEPLPNPVFEEPIRRLLGLTQRQYMDVVSGADKLNGKIGGTAIKEALGRLDIDREMAAAREAIAKKRGSARDDAVKRLGYLQAAKQNGIHPSSWVVSKIPVLPPTFRPVSRMGDVTLQADLNELYRDLIESNNSVNDLRNDLPDSALVDERRTAYESLSAVYGLGDPITAEGKAKRLKGAIRQVIGDSPKTGLFQSRVMSKPVDVVGRGVVTPDPNLDMDSVGIPEDSGWRLYKDFVVRQLARRNIPVHKALEMVDNRHPLAKAALLEEMKVRPVLIDRAPTWHKFNLLAFYPHLVEGSTVRVSPLITKGFTMDFDGDAVNFHVPVSDKAVDQAKELMLPSKNLFSLTDLRSIRHSPQQELGLGLYQLTQEPNKKPVQRFATAEDALKAYKQGKLRANDPIEIG